MKSVVFTGKRKVKSSQPKLFPNCCMSSQVIPTETVSVFFSEWNILQNFSPAPSFSFMLFSPV